MTEVTTVEAVPKVGGPATLRVGTDSYPMKVIEVDGKRVTAAWVNNYDPEAVIETRETGGYGWYRQIDVTHPSIVASGRDVYTLRKNGRYVREGENLWSGTYISFARAVDYRDPHF